MSTLRAGGTRGDGCRGAGRVGIRSSSTGARCDGRLSRSAPGLRGRRGRSRVRNLAVEHRVDVHALQPDVSPVVAEERAVGGIAPRGDAHERATIGEPRGVDDVPGAVDVGLGDGVEVHRLEPGGEARSVARGHVHRAEEGDDHVRVVAADALPGHERRDGTVGAQAQARRVGHGGCHERRHRGQQLLAREPTELTARLCEHLVGLAVPARAQVRDGLEVARARRLRRPGDDRVVADREGSRFAEDPCRRLPDWSTISVGV